MATPIFHNTFAKTHVGYPILCHRVGHVENKPFLIHNALHGVV